MLHKEVKYCYRDVAIIPSEISEIEHRSECNVFYRNGKLPIFTAPMSTVVSIENFDLFEKHHINAIIPRNINYDIRIEYLKQDKWVAVSLNEFETLFCNKTNVFNSSHVKVLIDIANGHMKKMFDLVKTAKSMYGDKLEIMVGNIANPSTYKYAVDCGVDYVRMSVGTGSGCITSSNTSIHYPIASLIQETFIIKNQIAEQNGIQFDKLPKIIADGGIRNFDDVNKALALGADYVMIGGVFASLFESAAKTVKLEGNEKININQYDENYIVQGGKVFYNGVQTNAEIYEKYFYGMASKNGQKDINGKQYKTSEGISKVFTVKYSIKGWVENMIHYLSSAMSYTNTRDVYQFKNVDTILISNNTANSINK